MSYNSTLTVLRMYVSCCSENRHEHVAQKLNLLDPYAVIRVYLKKPSGDPVYATDPAFLLRMVSSKYCFSCIFAHFCLYSRHPNQYLVDTILKSENHQPSSIYRVRTIFKNENRRVPSVYSESTILKNGRSYAGFFKKSTAQQGSQKYRIKLPCGGRFYSETRVRFCRFMASWGRISCIRQKGYAGTHFHTQIVRGAYAGYAGPSHSTEMYPQVFI